MQRLRQNNGGAALPLHDNEVLSASTTQTLPGAGWCHVRMRLAGTGEAERSIHLYDTMHHSVFYHESIVVPVTTVADLAAAVRAAFLERGPLPDEDGEEAEEDDSQGLFRTLHFRDGETPPQHLAVEYRDGKAVRPAAAFEAAWQQFAGQFPNIRPGHPAIPGLAW